jgi:aerobic C4-dicarboxylate transport protein
VPGSAFLALSATASSLGVIPAGAVALLLGVDRIMDSMRVATNLLGNCVAVFAVSRWEGALDTERAKKMLDGEIAFVEEDDVPRTQKSPTEEAGSESTRADIPAQSAKAGVPSHSAKEPAPEVG